MENQSQVSDQWVEASQAEQQLYIHGYQSGRRITTATYRAVTHWHPIINEVTEAYVRTLWCIESIEDGTIPTKLYRPVAPDEKAHNDEFLGSLVCLYSHWRHKHPECAGELYETIMKPLGITVEFPE